MSDDDNHELEIPDGVHDAELAIEVLRAWIADGSLHVIFDADTFADDFREWGRLLSEISHHVAEAATLEGHLSKDETLAAIRDGFQQGLAEPATARGGQLKGRTTH